MKYFQLVQRHATTDAWEPIAGAWFEDHFEATNALVRFSYDSPSTEFNLFECKSVVG